MGGGGCASHESLLMAFSCVFCRRKCTASTELNVQFFAWVDVAKSGCAMTNAVLFARDSRKSSRKQARLCDSTV